MSVGSMEKWGTTPWCWVTSTMSPSARACLRLALDPLEELLADHAGRYVLVDLEAVLIGGVLAGVNGDERHALGGAHHVGEAAAPGAALVEHGDRVAVTAVAVEVLELDRVDQIGMLGVRRWRNRGRSGRC